MADPKNPHGALVNLEPGALSPVERERLARAEVLTERLRDLEKEAKLRPFNATLKREVREARRAAEAAVKGLFTDEEMQARALDLLAEHGSVKACVDEFMSEFFCSRQHAQECLGRAAQSHVQSMAAHRYIAIKRLEQIAESLMNTDAFVAAAKIYCEIAHLCGEQKSWDAKVAAARAEIANKASASVVPEKIQKIGQLYGSDGLRFLAETQRAPESREQLEQWKASKRAGAPS